VLGYVSPKLTHRSFLTDRREKVFNGIPTHKFTNEGRVPLIGVNDREPGLVEVIPTAEELDAIRQALARRLSGTPGMTPVRVRAYFAGGGGGATPLILPEALAVLERHLIG
jgi:hypothetical protein